MVTKTFRVGLPTSEGFYFILNRGETSARLCKAIDLGGSVKTFLNGQEVQASEGTLSYGPVPDPERSLSSGARKPIAAAAQG